MLTNAFESKLKQVQPNSKIAARDDTRKVASGLCPEAHCAWFQTGRHCVLPCCFKKLFAAPEAVEKSEEETEVSSDG